MWIIPRNLHTSHSVQATEELTSDSRERLAELFAQLCRSVDNRTDELRLLGNGVVPDTAGRAFRELWRDLTERG
jgi:hypothetical protein